MGLLGLCWVLFLRTPPWPFKVLKPSGQHMSAPLPDGDALEERKRDFARIVAPSGSGLYVVTPAIATPTPWRSSTKRDSGDNSKETSDAVFDEFKTWLEHEVKTPTEDIAQRIVALVAVSEGFTFAMKH